MEPADTYFIEAANRLKEKGLDNCQFNFPVAVLSFFKSMADVGAWQEKSARFPAVRVNHPLSDADLTHWGKLLQWPMSVWKIGTTEPPVVVAGPVLSGPWCAMALEELKVFGARQVIGIGAVGAWSANLEVGDWMIAAKALHTDGVSREYSDQPYSYPSERLRTAAAEVLKAEGIPFKEVCVCQTDVLYRESKRKVMEWTRLGAECVNMESGTFYAVADALGLEAVYIGFVMDRLDPESGWTGWGKLDRETVDKNGRDRLTMLEDVAFSLAGRIGPS